jgi:hypothetical protein
MRKEGYKSFRSLTRVGLLALVLLAGSPSLAGCMQVPGTPGSTPAKPTIPIENWPNLPDARFSYLGYSQLVDASVEGYGYARHLVLDGIRYCDVVTISAALNKTTGAVITSTGGDSQYLSPKNSNYAGSIRLAKGTQSNPLKPGFNDVNGEGTCNADGTLSLTPPQGINVSYAQEDYAKAQKELKAKGVVES